jgi:hypothetical protein
MRSKTSRLRARHERHEWLCDADEASTGVDERPIVAAVRSAQC